MTTIVAQKWYAPNQPGWSGRFKAADGNYYGCKEEMAASIPIGQPVEVEITIKEKDGKTYRDIKRVVSTTPAPAAAKPQTNGARHGSTDDATAERIFVCGILNSYLRTEHFATHASKAGFVETLRNAVQGARLLYREEMGPQS